MTDWRPFDRAQRAMGKKKSEMLDALSKKAAELYAAGLYGNRDEKGTSRSSVAKLFEDRELEDMPFGYDVALITCLWEDLFSEHGFSPDLTSIDMMIDAFENPEDKLHKISVKFMDMMRFLYPDKYSYIGVWQSIKIANTSEFLDESLNYASKEIRSSITLIHYMKSITSRNQPAVVFTGRKADWHGRPTLYRTVDGDRYLDLNGERSDEPVRQIFHYVGDENFVQGINLGIAHVEDRPGNSPIAATRVLMKRCVRLQVYYLLNFCSIRRSTGSDLSGRTNTGRRGFFNQYIFNVNKEGKLIGHANEENPPQPDRLRGLSHNYEEMMGLLITSSIGMSGGLGMILTR